MARLLPALLLLAVMGCEVEPTKPLFAAPDLTTDSPLALARPAGNLSKGGERQAALCDDPRPFDAYLFYAAGDSAWRIEVEATAGTLDSTLAVYGPATPDEVWGAPLSVDDDSGPERGALIERFTATQRGEYLVLVGSYPGTPCGEYELTLRCVSGCEATGPRQCADRESLGCDETRFCEAGHVLDEAGCPTCECIRRSQCPCPEGYVCKDDRCEPALICPELFEPVCASDGKEYPNACEARRFGLSILNSGPCAECPSLDTCELDCGEKGLKIDEQGCALCECKVGCEAACSSFEQPVCGVDGVTYRSPCHAECAGVSLSSRTACSRCPSNEACDQRCPNGFVTDAEGCPQCQCVENDCQCEAARDISEAVCGEDGKTYPTACHASCEEVRPALRGPCPDVLCRGDEDCPEGTQCKRPEDCVSGHQCWGACVARTLACEEAAPDREAPPDEAPEDREGALVPLECPAPQLCDGGRCRMPCECRRDLTPVCGVDGKDYHNACVARCAGTAVRHRGRCCPADCPDRCVRDADGATRCGAARRDCECPAVYRPVCAEDAEGVVSTFSNQCEAECHGARVRCPGECPDADAPADRGDDCR